jgi:hypothetical protein
MVTKERVDFLAKAEGKVRGVAFKTDAEYVKNKLGDEALTKLRAEMEKIGFPIDYDKIKAMDWLPIGLRALHLEVIKDLFNWDDNEIVKAGRAAPKRSFILRLLLKYLVSIEQTIKLAPIAYKKHYSVGEFETVNYDLKQQCLLGRVKGSQILYDSSAFASHIEGYLARGLSYVVPGKEVLSSHRKYIEDGIPYVEFRISWK